MIFKRLIKRFQHRHIKEIILVDSENVGYEIAKNIPKTTLVYMFVSDIYVKDKLIEYTQYKNIKIIDISSIRSRFYTKNAMDFCLMAKLTETVTCFSNKVKIVVCSKDKGYDPGIYFLKERYQDMDILRYPGSLYFYYCDLNADLVKILQNTTHEVRELVSRNSNMETLKMLLPKSQRKIFIIEEYTNLVGMVKTYVELDVYTMQYEVHYSGNLVLSTKSRDEAFEGFYHYQEKLHHIYDKYQTHEKFKKSNELQIRQYIEEADLKKLPLEQCLIKHLGATISHQKYVQYNQIRC